jgi:DedD protein
MVKSATESEFDLKKRLVGAIVLIGFGVVVLPALLGGNTSKFGEDDATVTPRLDSKVFVSKITPIGGETPQPMPAPTRTGAAEVNSKAAAPEPDAAAPVKIAAAGSSSARAGKIAKPKPAPKAEAAVKASEPGWVVRVGTFAKRGNVERVVKRLEQAGFDPSTTRVETQTGAVTRVWIGPYAKRVEAARMRSRVQRVTGGEGYIAAYP